MNNNQKMVYDFIVAYKSGHDGNSPSLDEIAEAVGVSKAWAAKLLDSLYQAEMLQYHGTRQIEVGGKWVGPAVTP